MKIEELKHFKSPVELELMARVKAALDPDNLRLAVRCARENADSLLVIAHV